MFRGEQDSLARTNPGDVTWTTSADNRSNVNYYLAQARLASGGGVVSTFFLGKPVSANSAPARKDGTAWLNALSAGEYTVSIVAVNEIGSTDSGVSNTFTVPLAAE